jgi:hypothetical protein
MPNRSVRGPFNEGHFGNEARLKPMGFAQPRISWYDWEGRCFTRVLIQSMLKIYSLLDAEAGTNATRINQPVSLVDAEDERAESRHAFRRVGVAGDDKLLSFITFYFEPLRLRAESYCEVRNFETIPSMPVLQACS